MRRMLRRDERPGRNDFARVSLHGCLTPERTPMKNDMVLALATAAAVLTAAPLFAGTAKADPTQLAQVDVRIGPRAPDAVVVEPRRRPGVVIETEGRRDCRSVTTKEWRNGVRVTRTERRCD